MDEQIFSDSVRRLVDTNAPMFMNDIEKLTPSQQGMLKAILTGNTKLFSADTRAHFKLGNPNTIAKNKKALLNKPFIDVEDGNLVIDDPVFLLWYKSRIF